MACLVNWVSWNWRIESPNPLAMCWETLSLASTLYIFHHLSIPGFQNVSLMIFVLHWHTVYILADLPFKLAPGASLQRSPWCATRASTLREKVPRSWRINNEIIEAMTLSPPCDDFNPFSPHLQHSWKGKVWIWSIHDFRVIAGVYTCNPFPAYCNYEDWAHHVFVPKPELPGCITRILPRREGICAPPQKQKGCNLQQLLMNKILQQREGSKTILYTIQNAMFTVAISTGAGFCSSTLLGCNCHIFVSKHHKALILVAVGTQKGAEGLWHSAMSKSNLSWTGMPFFEMRCDPHFFSWRGRTGYA